MFHPSALSEETAHQQIAAIAEKQGKGHWWKMTAAVVALPFAFAADTFVVIGIPPLLTGYAGTGEVHLSLLLACEGTAASVIAAAFAVCHCRQGCAGKRLLHLQCRQSIVCADTVAVVGVLPVLTAMQVQDHCIWPFLLALVSLGQSRMVLLQLSQSCLRLLLTRLLSIVMAACGRDMHV